MILTIDPKFSFYFIILPTVLLVQFLKNQIQLRQIGIASQTADIIGGKVTG
jgi:hypothetical protein